MGYPDNIRLMQIQRAQLLLKKALLNLHSNRVWIIWGHSLYIRTLWHRPTCDNDAPIEATNWVAQSQRYLRWDSWFRGKTIPAIGSAIVLLELGMFGNMTRRLANSLALALAVPLGGVVVPKKWVFHEGIFEKGKFSFSEQFTVWFAESPSMVGNDTRLLMTTDLYRDYGLGGRNSEQMVSRAWLILRQMLVPHVPKVSAGSEHLTIHLRGGDVFGPRKPKAYGQPPLAFYSLVLLTREWSGVTIVCQDHANPVLEPLGNLCESMGLPYRIQNDSLDKDLTVLLAAENLVAGRGTFVPAVAGLSPFCKQVYYFHDKCNLVPHIRSLQTIRVVDAEGIYTKNVLANNWENSEMQRQLMITYPASALAFESS